MESGVTHVLGASMPTQTVWPANVRNQAQLATSVKIEQDSVHVEQAMQGRIVNAVLLVSISIQIVLVS